MFKITVAASMLVALLSAEALGRSDYVWWEGEAADETNFPAKTWFSGHTFPKTREQLSGGKWLTNIGKRSGPEAFAKYRLAVPAGGDYAFWARKFWKHGPFRWRFDRQEWRTCGRDIALADSVTLKTHVCANWVHLGKVRLAKGPHTFELRLLAKAGENQTAGFDCFILTRGPFVPRGRKKPGRKSGKADEGCFAWEPGVDAFGDDALLDLRGLNEKVAGQDGFVRRRGKDLVLGSGKAVRFWAVNVSANNAAQSHDSVDYLARKLAKLGVNMVRYHSPLFARGGDPAKVDPKKLDNLHYLVAAMKKQGIYTKVSFYFPLWFDIKGGYGIPGYDAIKNKRPFALLYFDRRMQEIHRSWAKALLTTKNPYTGRALANEPAVAIVEIVNEDSYFFWTFSKKNIPPVHWKRLETLYSKWLAERNIARKGELLDAWHMTAGGLKQGGPDKRKRVADQVRFLTMHQLRFYQSTVRYFRDELGYRGLISCSNWKTADANMLDALERFTYTAGDVIDRHGYFGGKHTGEGAGYSVRVGHTFADRAAVLEPQALPIQVNQVAGYPHIISELGWPNPNRYRADCTFLASAYGALQGVDGLFFFAVGSNYLNDQSMHKFAASCPVIAGTFPGAALQYRRGDVAEADVAVRRVLRLENLFALKGSAAAAQAFDKLRGADIPKGAAAGPGGLNPLSYYVGRVERAIGADGARPAAAQLSKHIDSRRKTVTSLDGRLSWDYGRGLVRVNTARSQGAAGFLSKAGRIALDNVTIESGNEYGAVMAISLDGKPLAASRRILIQAMTQERPLGFRTSGARITSLGGAPFGVKKIDVKITLKLTGPGGTRVVVLDENGYARRDEVRTSSAGQAVTVSLAADGVYHVVMR